MVGRQRDGRGIESPHVNTKVFCGVGKILGQARQNVNLGDYERHLTEQLCWLCHVPTSRSSAQQRQCPRCRRKWSFHQRQLRWSLLRLFATAITPAEAARRAHVSYRTAWAHFLRFEHTLRRSESEAAVKFLRHRSDIQKGRLPWKEISPDPEIILLVHSAEISLPPHRKWNRPA